MSVVGCSALTGMGLLIMASSNSLPLLGCYCDWESVGIGMGRVMGLMGVVQKRVQRRAGRWGSVRSVAVSVRCRLRYGSRGARGVSPWCTNAKGVNGSCEMPSGRGVFVVWKRQDFGCLCSFAGVQWHSSMCRWMDTWQMFKRSST